MSEKNEPTAALPAEPADPVETAAEPAAPTKRTLRQRLAGTGDRVYGARALLAATLAALIVGGVGGAAIHAAVDDGHDRGRFSRDWQRGGPGGFDRGGFGGFDRRSPGGFEQRGPGNFGQGAPSGLPTPVPPTTAPEDESDS